MYTLLFLVFACSDKDDSDTASLYEDTAIDDSEGDPLESDPWGDFEIDADMTIDATNSVEWVYFNMATAEVVSPDSPDDSEEWDLKFQRYEIGVNGGVSGTAGTMVLAEEGVYDAFDELEAAPEGEWITDSEDADGDDKPEYALQDWFNYDISTHVLTPKDVVYFIQTPAQTYKFRIVDYYGPNGESGFMSFDFAPVNEE